MINKLQITLERSVIGKLGTQKRVVKALGFTKRGQTTLHMDTPVIRGMINKVKHLVLVVEVNGAS
jgi:large subunit ribosomal protein L30